MSKRKKTKLSKRDKNTIFHALMDMACEERELHGEDTWNVVRLENLAESIADQNWQSNGRAMK